MYRVHIGLGILAVFLLAGWWLRVRDRLPHETEARTSPAVAVDRPQFERAQPTPEADIPASRWVNPVESTLSETEDLPEAPDGARPGELTLYNSDAAKFRQMLDAAAAAGLYPTRVIDALGIALFTNLSANDQARLRAIAGDEAIDYNYDVYTPDIPDPAVYGAITSSAYFADSARAFLGIPDDAHWGKGVKVAILDNGVLSHSAFANTRLSEIDLMSSSTRSDSEYSSHGTAVASILADTVPGAELISVKVLDPTGAGNAFTVAEGIIQAVDAGASVVSMSLGSYGDSEVLRQAVAYAVTNGVTLVAASGNDGVGQVTYPGGYRPVIGVGAIDANGDVANFSNYGEGIEIGAPGVGVSVAWDGNSEVLMSGTSASAPYVAGAVAGILSDNPGMSSAEATALIERYANDAAAAGEDVYVGNGILDVERITRRNDPTFSDAAVTGFWLDLSKASEEGTGSLSVTLQNRGNSTFSQATLEVILGGESYQFAYSSWEKGTARAETFTLPISDLVNEEGVPVSARLQVTGSVDEKSANNTRAGLLRVEARSSED